MLKILLNVLLRKNRICKDLIARIKVFDSSEGGRPVVTGYRPHFSILENYLTSGEITLIDRDVLLENEEGQAEIYLITPEIYSNSV